MGGAIDRLTDIFGEELNLGESDREVVKYSLTVYSTTVFGYLAIVLVAWPLGVIKLSLAAAVTGSLLRIFSGGAHASCSRNCILSGAVIFPVFGLIARFFDPDSFNVLYGIASAGVVFMVWSVYCFAPADTPGKPISSRKQIIQLRRNSFGVIILWSMWILGVYFGAYKVSQGVLLASALGFLWQGISLTPVGYRLVASIDTLMNLVMKGGEK